MRAQLLTIAVLTGAPVAAGEPSEFWHPGYASAAAEAQESGRPMLIHFYAEWCGPCRQMESRVLNQPTFQDALRDRVVAVKVDYDLHLELAGRFNVTALPCDLLIDSDGEVLLRTTGFVGEFAYVEQVAGLAPAAEELQSTPVTKLFAMMNRVGGAQHLGAVQDVGMRLLAVSEQ